jgi:nucleotide-binding universal stress UspA family protein
MYDKILVPLDGSAFAEQALVHAEQVAAAGRSEIHLVSVAPLLEDQALAVVDLYPVYVYRDYLADQEHELKRVQSELEFYLQRVCQRLQAAGHQVRSAVRLGQPAEEIIGYAEETGCTLIVMTTHGRSGLGRWVYGSVADKILRGSQVPVLLIRAHEEEKKQP